LIGSTLSHYRLVERLGGGGMGVVYKAWDLTLERFAAVKLLAVRAGGDDDDAFKRRFLREARAASSLDHPNLCTVYEAGESADGRLFIAMALCDGEPLDRVLRGGRLPLERAADIAAQVAAGLDLAHEKGVVHRDVKPANIILGAGGRAILVDFGIARVADQTRLTQAGNVMGTAAYMAPEQFLGAVADARSDVWSLGVVLYEMVTGSQPFRGVPDRQLAAEILRRDVEPMVRRRPGVPAELDRVAARALARRPADRYQRAGELGDALRCLAAAGVLAAADGEETVVEISGAPTSAAAPVEPPAAAPAAAGPWAGRIVSHYRLLGLIGGGGMGVVYKAEDTRLARPVALKFLPPELTRDPHAKARFLREAQAASALDHPNVCTIHEVGESAEGQLFLVMACYDGETLRQRLARGPLPVEALIDFALQIARGLAKAHRHGIVHRDVKPANLMITADEVLKILDFGIAKAAGAAALTGAGWSLGTPGYMSPEQARGEEIDARTDLWSLGAVVYEMAAGRRPFRGEHEQAVLYSLLHLDPEPLASLRPEVPPELARIAGRLLAKDPALRYPNAAEVIADLQALREAGKPAASVVTPGGSPLVVERRQLTALRCDLLPARADGGALDAEDLPEILHELMPELDRISAQAVGRFAGHVARRFADGLLVYFGYPLAHEDDSRRAVLAAFEIRAAIAELGARLEKERQVRLQVRAGIHTGLVVGSPASPGSPAAERQLALGETPAIAERLQGVAEGGEVVISEATRRLVAGFFETESLAPERLPAAHARQGAYRVIRDSGAETRFQVELRKGLTPLVGRGQEIALALARWAEARDGRGQVVMLAAEAGIGKSRLIEEIRMRIGQERHRWLECRCSPYHQNSAFYPLLAMLAAWLRLEEGAATPQEKLLRLERSLDSPAAAEQVPLIASLLGLPYQERYPPLALDPRQLRQRALEVLGGMVLEESQRQPVVFVVEDLPWADPSTLDWLDLFLEQVPAAPVLALLAFRPEFTPREAWRAQASQISLTRLNRELVVEMIDKVAAGKRLPGIVVDEIVRKTEGVPLFVEDLTRMVVESGIVEEREGAYVLTGPFRPLAVPDTLQEALMARLERLETARALAQLAAILGREFPFEMLREVTALEDLQLARELDRLVAAGLLYRRGLSRRGTYVWKHALVQEALVQSLLKRQRREVHKRIAEALVRAFPEIAASQPELGAHHWTEAGETEQAVEGWLEAARHALRVSANLEAVRHAAKGIELLGCLPESAERDRRELLLLDVQAPAHLALKGWASAEYAASVNRALALSRKSGASPELFKSQARLGQTLLVAGRLREAREVGTELLRIAEAERFEALELEARALLAATGLFAGAPGEGYEQARQGLAVYDPDRHHLSQALTYGHDPASIYLCGAVNLWQIGRCDLSRELSREALRLAEAVWSHAFSRVFALCGVAWSCVQLRDAAGAERAADKMLELARAHGFIGQVAWGETLRGAALAARGEIEEGIALMESGRAGWHATGAGINALFFNGLLAEACMGAGRTGDAQGWLDLALAAASNGEERNWLPEVHRLQGDLLRAGGAPAAEAESWLEQAREIARGQGALSLELRAVASLARQRLASRERGRRREEARRLLADTYGAFTEGFDTPDLVEAKELLAKFGGLLASAGPGR
jgi:TOMM system kinase/cyclase fusion protein